MRTDSGIPESVRTKSGIPELVCPPHIRGSHRLLCQLTEQGNLLGFRLPELCKFLDALMNIEEGGFQIQLGLEGNLLSG